MGRLADRVSYELAALASMVADHALKPRAHYRRICLFLGAGADVSSGGLTFAAFKMRAVERYRPGAVFDVTVPEVAGREFAALFDGLAPDARSALVEALFRQFDGLEPSDGTHSIALHDLRHPMQPRAIYQSAGSPQLATPAMHAAVRQV